MQDSSFEKYCLFRVKYYHDNDQSFLGSMFAIDSNNMIKKSKIEGNRAVICIVLCKPDFSSATGA